MSIGNASETVLQSGLASADGAAGVGDRYPTRGSAMVGASGRTVWVERDVPTVWGTHLSGPLSHESLAQHTARGFTVTEALLSPSEVQDYRAEIERLAGDPSLAADGRVVREPKSGAVRSIFEVHRISEAVAAITRDERVLGAARQLLGEQVYIHQSRINYMPGFSGKGFYWHSDFETWHAEDGMPAPRAVSLSIALTDNYPVNGALMLMPGSHQQFLPSQGKTPRENHRQSLVDQQVGLPSQEDVGEMAARCGIEQFTGPAGSGLWFDANMLHGSGNNITPYPRSNIYLVFNSVENAPVRPFDADARRPEHLAARSAEPLTGLR